MDSGGAPALINPFDTSVDLNAALDYEDVRPGYPAQAFAAVVAELRSGRADGSLRAVDIGAGTGQFTQGLIERGLQTTAVEPSASMREVLATRPWAQSATPPLAIVDGSGESTGLPDRSADLVVWAQCSHWLDIPRAATEAARILRPSGRLSVVANQLCVDVPWVHRLSRIMRSGDVARRDRAPALGPAFPDPSLVEVPWEQQLTVDQCLQLARTRSSYLAANQARRRKMQENLRWYLLDHLGLDPRAPFSLPYVTLVWSAASEGK